MLERVLTCGAVVTAVGGPWIPAAAATGTAILALLGWRRVRGTTLGAPAVWVIASCVALAAVEAATARGPGAAGSLNLSLWRYAAAVSTFCPVMAVLGAKRPQDRGWQWIVVSLWIILLVPAMQALAARSGSQLELFGAWRMLLWTLVAMELLNYLPTRFAIPAVVASIGQSLLLAPYLLDGTSIAAWRAVGPVALFASAGIAMYIARGCKQRPAGNPNSDDALCAFNLRWFCFRNGWGAFWGLRVLQRVNQTAELSDWPVRLEWTRGFLPTAAEGAPGESATIDQHSVAHIEQTLDSLLRRFERQEDR